MADIKTKSIKVYFYSHYYKAISRLPRSGAREWVLWPQPSLPRTITHSELHISGIQHLYPWWATSYIVLCKRLIGEVVQSWRRSLLGPSPWLWNRWIVCSTISDCHSPDSFLCQHRNFPPLRNRDFFPRRTTLCRNAKLSAVYRQVSTKGPPLCVCCDIYTLCRYL